MHSAKEVIYNELTEQYNKGKLSSIKIDKNNLLNGNEKIKQYKINYTKNEIERTIIIGTIDSFMYSIGNKNHNNKDFFDGIIESIKNDQYEQKSTIKYANDNIYLNKKSLIIIDEAQDLVPKYIEAIAKIMRNTYIDTYIIGDKLQSIWGDNNIHTYLENFDLPNTEIIRDIGKNQVRRFHNNNFISFVNDIIDFNKYNLPQIEDICDNPYCKYKHENNIIPYNIFEISKIYNDNNEENDKKINDAIEKIINFMNIEIDNYNYLPNNFMFIFPVLSSNTFAKQLEIRIQDFWVDKFKEDKYLEIIKEKDNYWNNYNANNFNKFVYLHKSDEGNSINLKESENASRILSIHASKGNGCEVVFLLNMNESVLKLYSKQKNNLQYDSLIHVAITRQKKSLYISIIQNNDDIHKRFKKYINFFDKTIKPNIQDINKRIELSKITKECYNDNIGNKYINNKNFEKLLPENNSNKKIIDWGHHAIRFNVFEYFIYYNIYNNEISEKNSKDQFKTILYLISDIKYINFKYYYEYIDKDYLHLLDYNRKKTGIKEIPLLQFHSSDKFNNKYNKYKLIIKDFIINIQKKIKESNKNNKLPLLCPLECVIIFHLIDIHKNDYKYQETSIMDIYSIIYYYDETFNSEISNCHDDYDCMCSMHFNKNCNVKIKKDDIKKSITKHYENVNFVSIIYNNLRKYITEKITTEPFTYHFDRHISFEKKQKADEFTIYKKFKLIAFSDSYIINFIIRPQFNILNYKEIIHESLINNYLILNQNSEANNYNRYNNKKILNCILTLDNQEPIFYHFYDSNLEPNCTIIQEAIKDTLYNIYSEKNKDIIDFYNYCKENKPSGKNSFEYICDELKEYKKIPYYIEDFFRYLKNNLTNNNREEIIRYISNTDELNKKLLCYIKDYLNIIDINNHIEDI